jgi:hypothetical protein
LIACGYLPRGRKNAREAAMKWWIGGTVIGLLAVSFYLASSKRSASISVPDNGVTVVETSPRTPAIPAPLVLKDVVEVADLDSLLDPPAIARSDAVPAGPILTQVGYEETDRKPSPMQEVKPIPKSKDDAAAQREREQLFSFWIGFFAN